MIIGLEEPVSIKNVGNFVAKIDSGNSGYNVIHGENIHRQGDVITFETVDSDGTKQFVSKKLKETVRINVGSGHVEKRPVVELDVQIADNEYQKIPFSVANRTYNKNKILLCKDFINNELNALIDPSGTMLTNKNQVNEGVLGTLGKAGLGALKLGGKGFLGGLKTVGKAAYKTGQELQKVGKFTDANLIKNLDGSAGERDIEKPGQNKGANDVTTTDKTLIAKKLKCKEDDLVCYKLADYHGMYYQGGETPTKAEQARYKAYNEAPKQETQNTQQQQTPATPQQGANQQQQNPQQGTAQAKQQNESLHQKLLRIVAEAQQTNAQTTAQAGAANPQAANTQQQPTNGQQQQQTTAQPQQQQQVDQKTLAENIYTNNRQNFMIYFFENKKGIKNDVDDYNKEVITLNKDNNFPSLVDRLFVSIGEKKLNFNEGSGESTINSAFLGKLKYLSGGDKAKETNSGFAICWGEIGGKRRCWASNVVPASVKAEGEKEKKEEAKPKNDEELKNATKEMSKNARALTNQYLSTKSQWQGNIFLKRQKLDLSKPDTLTALSQALDKQLESMTEKPKQANERFVRRGKRLLREADEQKSQITAEEILKQIEDLKKKWAANPLLKNVEFTFATDGNLGSVGRKRAQQQHLNDLQKLAESFNLHITYLKRLVESIDDKTFKFDEVIKDMDDAQKKAAAQEAIELVKKFHEIENLAYDRNTPDDVRKAIKEAQGFTPSTVQEETPETEEEQKDAEIDIDDENPEEDATGFDLHMDDIMKEEPDQAKLTKALSIAIKIVRQVRTIIDNKDRLKVEDSEWQQIISDVYDPTLSESTKFLQDYFRKMGIKFI